MSKLIVTVIANVKPECVEAFIPVVTANVTASRQEPGIEHFVAAQSKADPTIFFMQEIYKNPEAQLAHRESAHFKAFKEQATPLLVKPYDVLAGEPLGE